MSIYRTRYFAVEPIVPVIEKTGSRSNINIKENQDIDVADVFSMFSIRLNKANTQESDIKETNDRQNKPHYLCDKLTCRNSSVKANEIQKKKKHTMKRSATTTASSLRVRATSPRP